MLYDATLQELWIPGFRAGFFFMSRENGEPVPRNKAERSAVNFVKTNPNRFSPPGLGERIELYQGAAL
jgi:hypothetical protein